VTLERDLDAAVGGDGWSDDPEVIGRLLRDNSWLSPVISELVEQRRRDEGGAQGLRVAAAPASEEQLLGVLAAAARHGVAITPRGSGTSNFGFLTPTPGGLLLDLRRLKGPAVAHGDSVRAPAGVLQGDLEDAALAAGRSLTLLTTTFASATVGGWVAGGHVGLGSSEFGSIWDGNVTALRVATVSESPEVVVLEGADVEPALHTAGTTGVITEVAMPTVERREWDELVVRFDDFDAATRFTTEVSLDAQWHHRVVAAQEPALVPAFRALADVVGTGAIALAIVDRSQSSAIGAIASGHEGTVAHWKRWGESHRPSLAAMVYGHRMLWVKRVVPTAGFLHVYFSCDEPLRDVATLKRRFGDRVLLEVKYIRSPHLCRVFSQPDASAIAAAVVTVVDGDRAGSLAEVMAFCDDVGLRYQNPHAPFLEDSGLFPDLREVLAFKERVDPSGLCNPQKLRSTARR
jgi:hypothetical protein